MERYPRDIRMEERAFGFERPIERRDELRRPLGFDRPMERREDRPFDDRLLEMRRPFDYRPIEMRRQIEGREDRPIEMRRPLGFDRPMERRDELIRPFEGREDRPIEMRRPVGYEGESIDVVGLADEGDYNLMRKRDKIGEIRRDIPKLRDIPVRKEEDREERDREIQEFQGIRRDSKLKCGENLNICYMNTPTEQVIEKLLPDNSLVSLDKRLNSLTSSGMHGAIFYSYLIFRETDSVKKFKVALKFAKSKISDNLFYEYLVGLCVNRLRDLYPTFTRTLFISRINDNSEIHKKIEGGKDFELDYSEMEQLKQNMPSGGDIVSMKNLGEFCSKGENAVLITEFIDNIGPIKNYLVNPSVPFRQKLVNYINILFQIYYTLYGVREIFVHNDLHRDNVILHQAKEKYGYSVMLPENGIRVRDEVIKFKNKQLLGSFIPVIIDYGRSYINCDMLEKAKRSDLTTMNIARVLCKTPQCKGIKPEKRCGYGLGFNAISRGLNDEPEPTQFEKGDLAYGFKMLEPNESQDLRYFLSSMEVFETIADEEIKRGTVLDKNEKFLLDFLIVCNDNTIKPSSSKGYFIEENKRTGVSEAILKNLQYKEGFKINNIIDMLVVLSYIINSDEFNLII